MTWNVQQFPWIVLKAKGLSANRLSDTNRIAAVLLHDPDTVPDVIAFNEVFDEESAELLVKRLKDTWPHYVERVGTWVPTRRRRAHVVQPLAIRADP